MTGFILTSCISLHLQISGFAVIIVGAVIEAHYRTYLDFISSSYLSASSVLIGVGVLIFVVGFFGCCGAIKENHCMIVTVRTFMYYCIMEALVQ